MDPGFFTGEAPTFQPTILPRFPIKIETDKNLSVGVNSVSANGMEFIRGCKQFDSIEFFTTQANCTFKPKQLNGIKIN